MMTDKDEGRIFGNAWALDIDRRLRGVEHQRKADFELQSERIADLRIKVYIAGGSGLLGAVIGAIGGAVGAG